MRRERERESLRESMYINIFMSKMVGRRDVLNIPELSPKVNPSQGVVRVPPKTSPEPPDSTVPTGPKPSLLTHRVCLHCES